MRANLGWLWIAGIAGCIVAWAVGIPAITVSIAGLIYACGVATLLGTRETNNQAVVVHEKEFLDRRKVA